MVRLAVSEVVSAIGHWCAPGSPKPRQLADALERSLADGRLPLDAQLPGERSLAEALGVSRATLVDALTSLRAQGWLATRHGSGTTTTLPRDHTIRTSPTSFRPGQLDLERAMPAAPLHDVVGAIRAMEDDLRRELVDTGYHVAGIADLRVKIASVLSADGLPTSMEQVLITSGAMDALAASLRLVGAAAGRHQRVVVEAPTYPGALSVVHQLARSVPWPTPDDPTTLAPLLARHRPQALFLIADGHNPTGAIRSASWRAEVAHQADRHNVRLIVDHTLRALDLRGRPRFEAPVTASAPQALVVGSFGKIIWSGLRVGWLRASPTETDHLVDRGLGGASLIDQLLLLQLLDRLQHYVTQRRRHLARTAAALAAALPTDHLELPSLPEGGIAAWVRLTSGSATMLARAGAREGVALAPGPSFHADRRGDRHLRLPLTLDPVSVPDAVARLDDLARRTSSFAARSRPGGRGPR